MDLIAIQDASLVLEGKVRISPNTTNNICYKWYWENMCGNETSSILLAVFLKSEIDMHLKQ